MMEQEYNECGAGGCGKAVDGRCISCAPPDTKKKYPARAFDNSLTRRLWTSFRGRLRLIAV
jgi:hypothetical protein